MAQPTYLDVLRNFRYHANLFQKGKIAMKPDIHPEYSDVKVVCSCGSVFTTRSTLEKEQLTIDVCAACHPFFTGTQKIVDTAGRVDRFRQKYGKSKDSKKDADKQESAA